MLAPFEMSFELSERTFYPGDHIEAALVVESGKTAKAEIAVWLEARLHGRGNTHRERFRSTIVFRGEVSEGRHRYPATIEVPNGPFSYQGEIVNLTWMLCARADVPWAIDPKAEIDFNLEYRPTGMALVHVPDSSSFTTLAPTNSPTGKNYQTFIAAIAFVVLGGLGFAFAVSPGGIVPVMVICGFAVLMAVLLGGGWARRKVAEQKLGPVSLELAPQSPGPGESITMTCQVTPKKTVAINSIHCEFSAVERVVRGSGTNKTTYTEVIFQEWIPIAEAVQLTRGELKTFSASYTLPPKAPFSFDFPDNDLEWSFTLHIDIPSWPDWVRKSTFNVLPNARLLKSEEESPVATDDAPAEGLW